MDFIRSSIRNKMVLLMLLATVIPYGTSVYLSYTHTKKAIVNQTIEQNAKLLSEGQKNIGFYLNQIDELSLSIYNSTEMITLMRYGVPVNDSQSLRKITTVLSTILHSRDDIRSVNLYFRKSQQTFTVSHMNLLQAQVRTIPYEDIYRHAINSPSKSYILPPTLDGSDIADFETTGSPDTIAYQRVFIDLPGQDILGFLTININLNRIQDIASDLYIPGSSRFMLLNQNGRLVFDSAGEESESLDRWHAELQEREEDKGYIEWRDEQFQGLIFFNKMEPDKGGWTLVESISFQALYQKATDIVKLNIVIGVFAIILVLVATLLISFKITSPLQVLVRNIRKVKQGQFQVDFESLGTDEIGIVGDQFKSMVQMIDELLIKEFHLQLENKTNQLQMLQSQLNPHFLNNALQSINSLAFESGDHRVYQLIRALSKMMRYSMDTGDHLVTLQAEFDHVRSYLELQKQRFEERLSAEIEMDERCRNWKVPKMIVQPLVENYFKHAFDRQSNKGVLRIQAQLLSYSRAAGEDQRLQIIVEDNGGGMDERELDRLLYVAQQDQLETDVLLKTGLVNLFKRLRLYYGDAAEYSVINRPGTGLRIELLLPQRVNEFAQLKRSNAGGERHESFNY